MSLLTPIGLLGLIGVIALIIIYIIKPNYQNKFIPSTFIWKLSLKYKKKRIPISTLRNILIFLCQVAILTAAAFILTKPYIDNAKDVESSEKIIILDTSASMHTVTGGSTRFDRATTKALTDAENAINDGNLVSVIIAGDSSYYLVKQIGLEQIQLLYDAFDGIKNDPASVYTWGEPDISGAMTLAEQITSLKDNVDVSLYTDMTYYEEGNVKVKHFSDVNEYNAAILDTRVTLVENYYRIEIDVACYGKDVNLNVKCEIFNANDSGKAVVLTEQVSCTGDETKTIVFAYIPKEGESNMSDAEKALINQHIDVFSYNEIKVSINERDSLSYDNEFRIYGGEKPELKILYYSTLPNPFFPTALLVLQDAIRDEWNVQITEASQGDIPIEGYDIYIYEYKLPKNLPTDGVVICVNQQSMPASTGIKISSTASKADAEKCSLGEYHPIMNGVDASKILLTAFNVVSDTGDFLPVLTVSDKNGTYPLLLVKDELDEKIVVMNFSLHYSNLAIIPEFPLMLMNTVNHFFPTTLKEGFVYEVGDEVEVNARAEKLDVSGPGMKDTTLTKFPGQVKVERPGTYEFSQWPISGELETDAIYVKIPASESNINLTSEVLVNPYFYTNTDAMNVDLLFYFALAMVALLFIEWWLKSREQI